MNKEYLVAIMMDVQAGTRSCRHAAKEVMEWSDEQAAEIAALKAEVERFSNDDLHVIYMALHKLHADLIHRGESEQANKVEAIKNKVNNDWVAKLKAEGGAK